MLRSILTLHTLPISRVAHRAAPQLASVRGCLAAVMLDSGFESEPCHRLISAIRLSPYPEAVLCTETVQPSAQAGAKRC